MSSISVIIPAHNAAETIVWTLGGLADQDFVGDWEVIVVDDGSSDDTVSLARTCPLVARVLPPTGRGAAQARNAGAAAATGEVLAFLDADCRPAPGWLAAGVAALQEADIVQGLTCPDPSRRVGAFDRTLSVPWATGLFESANLFVRRELFERLGGFEHGLGEPGTRPFGEDVWFGWRARRIGARTGFCEAACVHHEIFSRGMSGYIEEYARLRYFPALAIRIPELREHFFYHRWFLSPRSAAFDLALVGCTLAAARRRPVGLLAVAPYAREIWSRVLYDGPRHAARMLFAETAADVVGLGALLQGSVTNRSLLL